MELLVNFCSSEETPEEKEKREAAEKQEEEGIKSDEDPELDKIEHQFAIVGVYACSYNYQETQISQLPPKEQTLTQVCHEKD